MGDMSIYLVQLDTGKMVRVTQPNIDRQADDAVHLGRDRVAQLARVQPGGRDGMSASARRCHAPAPQRRLALLSRLPDHCRPTLDALVLRRWAHGSRRGHRDAVAVAAAVLPDPVPDRPQDLLRGGAARRAAVHAAVPVGGGRRTADQAATSATILFLLNDPLYVERVPELAEGRGRSRRCCCLLLGYPDGLCHRARRRRRWRNMLLMLVILPFWTSFLLRVYAWIGLLQEQRRHQQRAACALGIIDEPLAMMQTDFAVYIGIVYSYLPFMILPLYANLEKHDSTLLEAAADLGARPFKAFLHDHAAAVDARHHRRLAAGVHPGGRRVRDSRAARRHRSR